MDEIGGSGFKMPDARCRIPTCPR